jgi:hypothetical protein
MLHRFPESLLWLDRSTVDTLLDFYDYPHPRQPGRIIKGYDRAHALRTAQMCGAVAGYLGHEENTLVDYQTACLLHDLGRAGLDQKLFGKIWTWASTRGIPTRPAAWRNADPETPYGKETEAFWRRHRGELRGLGITMDNWAKEQVEMRLGYARRLRRQIRRIKPQLEQLGMHWYRWMEQVNLYYYYPEKLQNSPLWVRELAEILVACEQLEACSNRERGEDYYNRSTESFSAAFGYLDSLHAQGQLGATVLHALRKLTAEGLFDRILAAARKRPLTSTELDYLRSLNQGA